MSDTGIGFPQEQASALFEPFVQGDGSSTRRYGGTGLGLAISKQLVEIMGGRIGVESKEGQGSKFWFTAVFKKQAKKEPYTKSAILPKENLVGIGAAGSDRGASRLPAPQQVRVLLAEDNTVNQAVAQAMLAKIGYRVTLVANGREALQALKDADFDLVLMDCEMPEMDGYEATRRIRDSRAKTRNPQIPIIAVTADAMSGDREKCLQAGMSDYIAKPVELPNLASTLTKWLKLAAAEHPIKDSPALSPAEARAIFNPETMLARLMNDKNLASKVITAFLEDAPKQLNALKRMLDQGDTDGARRQAHTLKGAAATMSAETLRALCAEAQEAAAAQDFKRASTLLVQMQEQFAVLKTALRQLEWLVQSTSGGGQ